MVTATNSDGPAFNTRSKTSQLSNSKANKNTFTPDLPTVKGTLVVKLKSLTDDRLQALLQIQNMDPFCICISKWLSNGKAPKHKADLCTQIRGLLYKHIMDENQKFMALIIPKAWIYTVLVETHDKLGHQGVTHTYCLIK